MAIWTIRISRKILFLLSPILPSFWSYLTEKCFKVFGVTLIIGVIAPNRKKIGDNVFLPIIAQYGSGTTAWLPLLPTLILIMFTCCSGLEYPFDVAPPS